jgi:P27 family predicted phage terminase small subunit
MKTGPKPRLAVVAKTATPDEVTPAWVPRNVKPDWARIVTQLVARGLFDDGKVDVIAAYLSALSTMRRCQRAIERQGAFFKKAGEAPKPHPAFALMAEAEKRLRLNASRLGLIEESRDVARKGAVQSLDVDDDDFGEDDV